MDLQMVYAYEPIIAELDRYIAKTALHHDPVAHALLNTIPGVGTILSLVILYEIENIKRFPRVQDFVSYCRLVKCAKESNGKKTGKGNKKIGNPNLKWAICEATIILLRESEQAKKLHQKLIKKNGEGKALGILSNKLGRAIYYMLKNKKAFDMNKFFSH